jgi:hypothetical protein
VTNASNFCKEPIDDGSRPCNLFWGIDKEVRFTNDPMVSGTVPVKQLNDRNNISRCDKRPMLVGIDPFMRFEARFRLRKAPAARISGSTPDMEFSVKVKLTMAEVLSRY